MLDIKDNRSAFHRNQVATHRAAPRLLNALGVGATLGVAHLDVSAICGLAVFELEKFGWDLATGDYGSALGKVGALMMGYGAFIGFNTVMNTIEALPHYKEIVKDAHRGEVIGPRAALRRADDTISFD